MKAVDGSPVIDVTAWEPTKEAYRCPAFSSREGYGNTYSPHFDHGTVIALDGADHTKRRRLLNGLLENMAYFRDNVFVPAVERNLKEVMSAPDTDGVTRLDLVPFNMRVSQQMAAAMVGLDKALTTAGVDELLGYVQSLGKSEGKLELIIEFDIDSVMPKALAARQAIHDVFYLPAVQERSKLVERYRKGEIERSDLPIDLITLLLVHGEEAGIDEAIRFREVLLMLTAGTMTTALSTTWAVHEILNWVDKHPEDRANLTDPDFLLTCFQESLRLHPGAGANLRRATADVTLKDGTMVHEREFVLLHKAQANRDAAVFGADVNEFNPRRQLPPSVNAYGLAFGHGPHKCLGMPMVIGTRSAEGIALQTLRQLFAVGVSADPDRPPRKFESAMGALFDQWASYPLIVGQK